jgi:cellobiose-specific phosphotransferase system component IIB
MATELPTHMDNVKHKKGMIDLDANSEGFFGLDDYKLSFVFDDIVLVEFIDEVEDAQGSVMVRNGLYIPTNVNTKAWRKAKVVLVGPNVQYCKPDDIVIFPNDKGVTVANMEIDGYGTVTKGMFLNEQRLFGIAKKKEIQKRSKTK